MPGFRGLLGLCSRYLLRCARRKRIGLRIATVAEKFRAPASPGKTFQTLRCRISWRPRSSLLAAHKRIVSAANLLCLLGLELSLLAARCANLRLVAAFCDSRLHRISALRALAEWRARRASRADCLKACRLDRPVRAVRFVP